MCNKTKLCESPGAIAYMHTHTTVRIPTVVVQTPYLNGLQPKPDSITAVEPWVARAVQQVGDESVPACPGKPDNQLARLLKSPSHQEQASVCRCTCTGFWVRFKPRIRIQEL